MNEENDESEIVEVQSHKRFKAQESNGRQGSEERSSCDQWELNSQSTPENYTTDTVAATLFTWIEKKNEITDFQVLLAKVPGKILNEVQNTVKDKKTILQKALQAKLISVMRLLLEYGADLYKIPPEGNSTFHLAIYDKTILREVIDIVNERQRANAKEEIPDECGKVVYYAIFEKKFESLEILLEDGSPFRRFIDIDLMKVTPLHVGFGEGHPEAVKILIDAKANIFRRVQDDGILPLHVAAAKGNFENICLLLSAYDKYIVDAKKEGRSISMVKLLGAKTRQTKMTAFNFASFRGNWRVLDLLLRITTAYLNTPSSTGMCPIHYAVSEGQDIVVATLLSRKPNIFLEDRNGNNALVYASYKNRYHSSALILNHINQHRYEYTNGPLKRNLVFDIKVSLVLFILDTTRVMEVNVTFQPNFNQLMSDLERLRDDFFKKSTIVGSNKSSMAESNNDVKWRKFHLVHLKYVDENNEVISKGSGILRDYLPHAAEIILKSKYFISNDGGRTFDFAYFPSEVTEEMIGDMRRIGFYLALVILAHPVNFPLAKYIFKTLACEEVQLADLIGQSTVDVINNCKHLNDKELEGLIPNGATVQIDGKQTEILFDKNCPFVSKSNIKQYMQRLQYHCLYGGGKRELLAALCEGFYSVIPKFFLYIEKDNKIFPNPILYSSNLICSDDLQQLLGDVPLVVEEWKQYTVYNLCGPSTPEVIWFWEIVNEETEEWRRKLLKFATGTSLLPIGSFLYLRNEKVPFTIELFTGNEGEYWLPTARTCTYTLSIPSSRSKELLHQSLTYACNHCYDFAFF